MKIFVKVKIKAKSEKVEKIDADHFEIWVKAPPIEGKANEKVVELLSEYLDVPRSSLNIIRGAKSRNKIVEIKKLIRRKNG